jgi:chromate transporter
MQAPRQTTFVQALLRRVRATRKDLGVSTTSKAASELAVAVPSAGAPQIPFAEAVWTWARVAALSFGGPAGQIAVMQRILVEEKRWIGETRFLHALNYCMLLPGPEAHELAIYIGWLMHRVKGGIVAGTLFVLPGLVALALLSFLYVEFGSISIVQALFFGLKAAVLAVVIEAVLRVGKRALKNRALIIIACAAFLAIFAFGVPFSLIVGTAALVGFAGTAANIGWFRVGNSHGSARDDGGAPALIDAMFARETPEHVRPSARRSLIAASIGSVVWLGPLYLLMLAFGAHSVFARVGLFNAKMAVVTFGGAYAVLAYMAQQAVEYYHWLKPGEMLVGLGFAETTPGPLISVVQFVGFVAAFRAPTALDPVTAGFLGGFTAMWATFVPPFIWIFVGGPYIEALIGNKSLNAALSAITAAVVGVILNLAAWFALHVLFAHVEVIRTMPLSLSVPVLSSLDWRAVAIAIFATVALFRFKMGMIPVLASSCGIGMGWFIINSLLAR